MSVVTLVFVGQRAIGCMQLRGSKQVLCCHHFGQRGTCPRMRPHAHARHAHHRQPHTRTQSAVDWAGLLLHGQCRCASDQIGRLTEPRPWTRLARAAAPSGSNRTEPRPTERRRSLIAPIPFSYTVGAHRECHGDTMAWVQTGSILRAHASITRKHGCIGHRASGIEGDCGEHGAVSSCSTGLAVQHVAVCTVSYVWQQCRVAAQHKQSST